MEVSVVADSGGIAMLISIRQYSRTQGECSRSCEEVDPFASPSCTGDRVMLLLHMVLLCTLSSYTQPSAQPESSHAIPTLVFVCDCIGAMWLRHVMCRFHLLSLKPTSTNPDIQSLTSVPSTPKFCHSSFLAAWAGTSIGRHHHDIMLHKSCVGWLGDGVMGCFSLDTTMPSSVHMSIEPISLELQEVEKIIPVRPCTEVCLFRGKTKFQHDKLDGLVKLYRLPMSPPIPPLNCQQGASRRISFSRISSVWSSMGGPSRGPPAPLQMREPLCHHCRDSGAAVQDLIRAEAWERLDYGSETVTDEFWHSIRILVPVYNLAYGSVWKVAAG